MKKLCFVSADAFLLLAAGCTDSSRHTPSLDDLWIQQQLQKGALLPGELSELLPGPPFSCAGARPRGGAYPRAAHK